MTVAIVTDSGSDLTPAALERTGITQVPMSVSFNEETFLCPDEMTPDEFWRRLRNPGCPFAHTAAPSVGLFKQTFEGVFSAGHESVVCVCISESLSATIKHAQMAREMLPDRQIFIVDSRSASMGLGALALRGAELADAGTSGAEIQSQLTVLRDRLDLYVGLETLDYLRKGGRISHAKAAIGGLLSIKPIVTIEEGVVVVADQPRTRSKATERVVELLTGRPVTELHALYSPPVDVDAFLATLLAQMPEPRPKVITAQVIGPVIGAHVGPGAYGAILVR